MQNQQGIPYEVTYSVYDWTVDPCEAIAGGTLTPPDGVSADRALELYGEHYRNAMQGVLPRGVSISETAQIEFNYRALFSKESAPQRAKLERAWSKGKGPQLPNLDDRCYGR